ncbi:hypothetical protein CYMTET_31325, partial [Cymbomonas tetramitiformis]
WLRQDSTIECFTSMWYTAAGFATLGMLYFVIGYPAALALVMRYLRTYVKARMPRAAAERQIDLVKRGLWIPVRYEDKVLVSHCHSLFMSDSKLRKGIGSTATMLLSALGEVQRKSEAGTGENVLRRISGKWKAKAKVGQNIQEQQVEMFLALKSFCEVEPEVPEPAFGSSLSRSLSRSMSMTGTGPTFEGLGDDETQSKQIRVLHSNEEIQTEMFMRADVGDAGAVTAVPITRLDGDVSSVALAQFFDPFEYSFYFWQCYEIVRRLLQTGMVVVVEMLLASEDGAIIYSILVSVAALNFHSHFSPYTSDTIDRLQFCVLLNQFCLQMMVISVLLSQDSGTIIGVVMLIVQMMVVSFSLYLMFPAYKGVFYQLAEQVQLALRKISDAYFNDSTSSAHADMSEMTVSTNILSLGLGDDADDGSSAVNVPMIDAHKVDLEKFVVVAAEDNTGGDNLCALGPFPVPNYEFENPLSAADAEIEFDEFWNDDAGSEAESVGAIFNWSPAAGRIGAMPPYYDENNEQESVNIRL